jgi:hypothetical protein
LDWAVKTCRRVVHGEGKPVPLNAEYGMRNDKEREEQKNLIEDCGIKNGAKNLIVYKFER